MTRVTCLAAIVTAAVVGVGHTASADDAPPDLAKLAQDNLSVHRFSTSVKAQEMKALFRDDQSLDKAVAWCQRHGITRVYLETFRFGYLVERPLLERVRNRFRDAGIETRGLVTPTIIGKASNRWNVVCCYSDLPTQRRTREIFEYTASFFDTILIDDFWFTDCTCDACSKAMAAQTVTIGSESYPVAKADWPHYRGELMCRLADDYVLKACKAVNPKVRVIVKFPCWYDTFHKRGYDVQRMSKLFDGTWVGTETRDFDGEWGGTPQMGAFFIARWVASVGEGKCEGAWYDPLRTTPATYLEQARLSVLGGAPESLLHSYGYLSMTPEDAKGMDDIVKRLKLGGVGGLGTPHGPRDIEHLRVHMPELFAVAKEVKARTLTGIAAFKPANSDPGGEVDVFSFLGMLGLPLNPCHKFPDDAPAACFASYVRDYPNAAERINGYIASGRPTLITDGLAQAMRGRIAVDRPNVVILPVHGNPRSLLKLTEEELDAIRAPFFRALGHESFRAPNRVGVFLFEDGSRVTMNFNDQPVEVALDGENHDIAPREWLCRWGREIGELRRNARSTRRLLRFPVKRNATGAVVEDPLFAAVVEPYFGRLLVLAAPGKRDGIAPIVGRSSEADGVHGGAVFAVTIHDGNVACLDLYAVGCQRRQTKQG